MDGNFVVYIWNGFENNLDVIKLLWVVDMVFNGYVSSGYWFVVFGCDGNFSMYGFDFLKLFLKKEFVLIVVGIVFGGFNVIDNVLIFNLVYLFLLEVVWKFNFFFDGFFYLLVEYFFN